MYGLAGVAVGRKGPVLRLGMGKGVLNSVLQPIVLPVGPELRQEDDLPQGAPVLGGIAWTGLDPVAIHVLGIQSRGDRTGAHYRGLCTGDIGVVRGTVQEVPQGKESNTRIILVRLQQPGKGVCL